MREILLNRKVASIDSVLNSKKTTDKIFGICAVINMISLTFLALSCYLIIVEVNSDKDVFLFTNDGRVIEYKKDNG